MAKMAGMTEDFKKRMMVVNENIGKIKDKAPKVGMVQEFKDFLKEYKVVGLAVAFIMATAATTLVQSLVNNIIMPLITPFIPKGEWQTAQLVIGPISLGWGAFLSAFINFMILAYVVFLIAKFILKEEKVTKK
jgi:large conductance mechanosensitive channel